VRGTFSSILPTLLYLKTSFQHFKLKNLNKNTVSTSGGERDFLSACIKPEKLLPYILKVPKCEILISWILMIFNYHEVSIGRGL
jgi:hypothetical protein